MLSVHDNKTLLQGALVLKVGFVDSTADTSMFIAQVLERRHGAEH